MNLTLRRTSGRLASCDVTVDGARVATENTVPGAREESRRVNQRHLAATFSCRRTRAQNEEGWHGT